MKYLLTLITILILSGCTEKEVVYVDVNGSIIKEPYKQLKATPEIRCDKRGYAYYESTYGHGYSLTPILANYTSGVYQVLCKDL